MALKFGLGRRLLAEVKRRAQRWLGLVLVLFAALAEAGGKTTPLAPVPDWGWLEACKGTFTRAEFQRALDCFYAPEGAASAWVELGDTAARIRTKEDVWVEVPFAGENGGKENARYWRRASEMPPASGGKPLAGVRVAIDPGHLGGEWARMEERFFQIGKTRPVAEGDLTLAVARKLKAALEKYGASVVLLRKSARPLTKERPASLRAAAAQELQPAAPTDKLDRLSELYFYRISEIRARAAREFH